MLYHPNSQYCRDKWMETAVDQNFQSLGRMSFSNKDKVRAAVNRKRKREEDRQRENSGASDSDLSDDGSKREIGLFANRGTKRRKNKGDLPKYLGLVIALLIGFFTLLVTSFGAPQYSGVQHCNGQNSKVVSMGESEMHLYSIQTLALIPILLDFVHWKIGFMKRRTHSVHERLCFTTEFLAQVSGLDETNSFLVDSGATSHMKGGENFVEFTRYRKCDGSEFVKFGDGSKEKIVGKGDIKLKCGLKLRNFLHVPKLKIDLVSVGKLDQHGMTTVFHNGGSIRSGRKTVCSLTFNHGLY
jgi:hypothetical protein